MARIALVGGSMTTENLIVVASDVALAIGTPHQVLMVRVGHHAC
jgi:hypothetical protein